MLGWDGPHAAWYYRLALCCPDLLVSAYVVYKVIVMFIEYAVHARNGNDTRTGWVAVRLTSRPVSA